MHFESDKQTIAVAKTSCHKKLVLHCKTAENLILEYDWESNPSAMTN